MEILGNRKNNNAPLIYKILINCFTFCGIADRVYIWVNVGFFHSSQFQVIFPDYQKFTRQCPCRAFTSKHRKINRTGLYNIMSSND
jgi:hypothetical protein